jgi:regulator of RNase E activity RraA
MTTITNPPAAALLERVRNIDPAALADANKQIRVVSSDLRPLQSGLQLLGRAYTVRCDGDFLEVIAALAEAAAGDVLVVDAQSSRLAMVGELFSLEAARRGLGGIVVDGAVRDVSVIRTLTMPVYARTITPVSGGVGAGGAGPGPGHLGGGVVNTGEIVVGDHHGLIGAPHPELWSRFDAGGTL